MKLKHLESALQDVVLYSQLESGSAKLELEQYSTSPHLASCMVYTAHMQYGDIEDMNVMDMGCGTGILGIAASIMGAGHVTGLDIDPDALSVATENAENCEIDNIDFINGDISCAAVREGGYHTVLMNPPFGTRRAGADVEFLAAGVRAATRAVYSMHKTSTRAHIMKVAREWGTEPKVIAQLRFDIPATYSHHKKKSVDVEVDLWRLDVKGRCEKAKERGEELVGHEKLTETVTEDVVL